MEISEVKITAYTEENGFRQESDVVSVESPLEIFINGKKKFVCMRLPGMDRELAAGLCFNSGLVDLPGDIKKVEIAGDNRVDVKAENIRDLTGEEISIIRSSSGLIPDKIDNCESAGCRPGHEGPVFTGEMLFAMQKDFFQQQKIFEKTGGTHAAAFYDIKGDAIVFAEDVGRHNALDKCTGYMILNGKEGEGYFCILSSRLSYEMVIKGIRSGATVIAGVSAPTSLAVSIACDRGITLAGFVRKNRFNIYSGEWRISKGKAEL